VGVEGGKRVLKTREVAVCDICGYGWLYRKGKPKRCARCKSRQWDRGKAEGVSPEALAMWDRLRKAIWKWGMLMPDGERWADRIVSQGNRAMRLGSPRKRNQQVYGG
jgi:hypothetical protein